MDWGLIDRKPNFRWGMINRKPNFRFIETKVIDRHLCKHEPPYVIEDLLEMELCRMKKRESQ